jgi:hypothetical protein
MMSTESTRGPIQGHEPFPDSRSSRSDLRRHEPNSTLVQLADTGGGGDLPGSLVADWKRLNRRKGCPPWRLIRAEGNWKEAIQKVFWEWVMTGVYLSMMVGHAGWFGTVFYFFCLALCIPIGLILAWAVCPDQFKEFENWLLKKETSSKRKA